MKLKAGDAIRVVWVDACGVSDGWRAPYKDGVEVENVSVFVLQNKNGMCLAKGMARKPDGGFDLEQTLEPSFIPRGMVRKIRKLR